VVLEDAGQQTYAPRLTVRHQDRPRVALRESAFGERLSHLLWQVQQAQRVCYRHAALANPLAQLLLRQSMLVEQLPKRVRFLKRVQVPPLDVFDQRHLQACLRRCLFDHRWDGRHAGELNRTPAALARDQLKRAVWLLADEYRLQDAMFADRLRQLRQFLFVEMRARLPRVRSNGLDRHLAQADSGAWNQGAQPTPQTALARTTHRSSPRRISSWARSA
jgi:hypothetical protein